MKKTKYLFFMVIGLLVTTMNVNAKICSEEEVNVLKSVAEKVIINYELNSSGVGSFYIDFFNLDERIYLIEESDQSRRYTSNKEDKSLRIQLLKADETQTFKYDVYSTDSECFPSSLKTIELNLPKFNELSKSEICDGNQDLPECNQLIDNDEPIMYEDVQEKIVEKQAAKDNANKSKLNTIIIIVVTGVVLAGVIYLVIYLRNKNQIKKRGII